MSSFKALTEAVIKGDINKSVAETQKAIDSGCNIQAIIDEGLIFAMDEVGERFSKGIIFVPQMLRSAKTMQECMKLLEPLLKEGNVSTKDPCPIEQLFCTGEARNLCGTEDIRFSIKCCFFLLSSDVPGPYTGVVIRV